jgi:hypothetical protein
MEQLRLLELLAKSAFPDIYMNELCREASLPKAVKEAFLSNDSDELKKALSSNKYFANESHVAQIQFITSIT